MAKKLVIVESPTKAKTIGKILGSNYKVIASVGHLRDLPKSKMGIDIENNFEPEYISVRGKGDIIKQIKKEAKASDKVLLATDPDREGEAISWHISNLLKLNPTDENRIEFHEITKETVKNSINKPRAIDMRLVDAQQARRVLDRLVGYEISPILWKKVKSGLSAGRVQSVALRLLCEREKEIREFKPQEYWTLSANHKKDKMEFESNFYGFYKDGKEQKLDIKTEKGANEILKKLDKDNFEVVDVKVGTKNKQPYPPYTTSTLQQDANRRLNFSASKTMTIAQQLYEGIRLGREGSVGLISYMRTDSTRISSGTVQDSLDYIIKNFGKEFATKGNPYGKNKKNSQDAHEAIRPSSVLRTPNSIEGYLSKDQYKLYELIWTRTVASQMSQAKYKTTSITINNNNFIFKINGNVESFKGFTKLYKINDTDVILPEIKKNEILKAESIDKKQHFTKPKSRFTEASLVKTLEEDGIGRPSTYASIISSLTKRNYVELKQKKFFTTELGEKVNSFLIKYFDEIINEEFTAEMEAELDKIADDGLDWKNLVSDFYDNFEKKLLNAKEDDDNFKVIPKKTGEKCPECGHDLVVKHGRNGKFIGCSNFPDCTYTKVLVKKIGINCPDCKDGDIIEKVSKRGKIFYGCSNYPDCDFAVWDKPINEKCPKCGHILVHKKNRKVDEIKCSNTECDYVK
ncbi:type I DNA topoisomerase [Lagierella massiliensis]|uniref:type I DNA topoisomerase n=1 Tax=Lagierella massiliensis TaxID=1689303 RepID=UPI0006D7E8CE|nr:type I DNA topoisomerase [Lagierella massiliensis]